MASLPVLDHFSTKNPDKILLPTKGSDLIRPYAYLKTEEISQVITKCLELLRQKPNTIWHKALTFVAACTYSLAVKKFVLMNSRLSNYHFYDFADYFTCLFKKQETWMLTACIISTCLYFIHRESSCDKRIEIYARTIDALNKELTYRAEPKKN